MTVTDNEVKVLDEAEIDQSLYDPLKDLIYYRKPTPGLLENYPVDSKVTDQEIFDNKNRIKEILNSFGIPIQKINATTGPTVTLYEIVQGEGVRISKIQGSKTILRRVSRRWVSASSHRFPAGGRSASRCRISTSRSCRCPPPSVRPSSRVRRPSCRS